MAGCFGNSDEDRGRERQVDRETRCDVEWATCLGCMGSFEADLIDEDGLCDNCANEDDELEFAGDDEESE